MSFQRQEYSSRLLVWYLIFRVLAIALFLGGALLYQLRGDPEANQPTVFRLYLLAGCCLVQALISSFYLPRVRLVRKFIQGQIAWDLLTVIALVFVTGGVQSQFSFLFILVIVSSGIFLNRRDILIVASAAAILYCSMVDLQYYGYLPVLKGAAKVWGIPGIEAFHKVFVHFLVFLLTGLLTALLVQRLRSSEQALQKRLLDYQELENLNRTILAHITSGLMTVDRNGAIQSFNQSAERIADCRREEILQNDVRGLFPALKLFEGEAFRITERDDCQIRTRTGEEKTVGYTTTLLKDGEETVLGLLVIFQDVTHVKEMENRLKRSDKLAAVGRMASGLAHEIRNPLASISGSVQLLMEDGKFSTEEKNLMRIVIREADRLSRLLTDFLHYARPAPVRLEEVNVSRMLDELADMMKTDSRFNHVTLRKDYGPGCRMRLDRGQISQSLWNLILNAAEAMAEQGVLTLGAHGETGVLYVEDNGHGIPPDIRPRIFDPFFTTKDKGTGLGLATVHTIVEQHGGSIDVSDGDGGGTRFVITLPGAVRRTAEAQQGESRQAERGSGTLRIAHNG
ncbi:MAG: PAS domain S-box protein [Deltaproteobacteria bacterium]|nr:PAS domain S-box protein [Deltaproteobacteria bacterium]